MNHWTTNAATLTMAEHEALIKACCMVQKHWRGVRAHRLWVGMLEKAADAEVDLSGLDLS
jgi:hypothetical protein